MLKIPCTILITVKEAKTLVNILDAEMYDLFDEIETAVDNNVKPNVEATANLKCIRAIREQVFRFCKENE